MDTAILRGALVALVLSTATPAAITYHGTFAADDDMFTASFSLAAPASIAVDTTSFATGGFAPVVSLFDSTGNLLVFDDGGVAPSGCGLRSIDPVTGFCLDAYISGFFPSGSYMVVLTEWDSTPNGPTLSDGFFEQGNGNFTGGPFLLNAGSSYQRTGDWTLTIPGTAIGVPEPSYAMLIGIIVLFASHRRRHCVACRPLAARAAATF